MLSSPFADVPIDQIGSKWTAQGLRVYRERGLSIADLVLRLRRGDEIIVIIDAHEIRDTAKESMVRIASRKAARCAVQVTEIRDEHAANAQVMLSESCSADERRTNVSLRDFIRAWSASGNYATGVAGSDRKHARLTQRRFPELAVYTTAETGSTALATLGDLLARTPAYTQVLPLDAVMGWPWPVKRTADTLYIGVPYFRLADTDGDKIVISPPTAAFTVDWRTGSIVAFENFCIENSRSQGDEPTANAQFPHIGAASMKPDQYAKALHDALARFGDLFDKMLQEPAVSLDIPAAIQLTLSYDLRLVMPHSHRPFYRKIAPAFFNPIFDIK